MKIDNTTYNDTKTFYEDLGRKSCPLCQYDSPEQEALIVWKGTYWYIVHAKFPYTNTGKHLMVVPYKHYEIASDIPEENFVEFGKISTFMDDYFGEESYFSFTRETFDNRSLAHYHIHFVNGMLQGKYLREMLKEQGLF